MRLVDVTNQTRISATTQELPSLDWVSIRELRIDDTYQRPLGKGNWTRIRKIASDFRWTRFTPVLVSPLEEGGFAVIDGQHRVHAAALCGFDRVPAMVVEMERREQASSFSHVNGSVTAMSAFHVYKAALAAGEAWAEACQRAVAEGDCRLMVSNSSTMHKKPGEVFAVSLIRDLVAKDKCAEVSAALGALRDYDESGRVGLYSAYILRPWLTCVAEVGTATRDGLAGFLAKNDPYLVIERARRLHKTDPEFRNRPMATVDRQAFIALLRHHLARPGSVA